MKNYVGIDLGTSSVKVLLLSGNGKILSSVTREYPLYFPRDGWAEQEPEDWYNGVISALKELLKGTDGRSVRAFSFSGQMHGLVMLDERDKVIRPAILWNDSRSDTQTDFLNTDCDFLLDNTGNIAFAGFTLPKLMWVKENEPQNYARIRKIMLPKDYIAYRMTGEFTTDVSDASGTLYFDVKNRTWSDRILKRFDIDPAWLPRVLESDECAGKLCAPLCDELSVNDVSVIIGAGDNAAAAVGTGAVNAGDCNISLGTSGTVFCVSDSYNCDRENAIHSFCSASRSFHYLACVLSAAVCCNWWVEKILRDDYSSVLPLKEKLGDNNIMFLPYLMGERSPIKDTEIRGAFLNLSLSAAKDDMTLAVLEGVAFALRHNVDSMRALGTDIVRASVCGGGSKNTLWLEIIASVLNIELSVPENQDGAALGAAMLAAKGIMSPADYALLEKAVYKTARTVIPDPVLIKKYNEKYNEWIKIYPAIKKIQVSADVPQGRQ